MLRTLWREMGVNALSVTWVWVGWVVRTPTVGEVRCREVRVMLGPLPVPDQPLDTPYSVEDLQAGVRQPQPGDPGFVGSLVDYHQPKCMDWCELVHWEPALTPSQ